MVGTTNTLQNRQRNLTSTSASSRETDDKEKRTGTLVDLDALNCTICFDTLTIPIFQCGNGHVACSPCCEKLNRKCGTCSLPSLYRNRAMERVLEQLVLPCPNAEYGCTKNISYDERPTHMKQCAFTPCVCPFSSCTFTGSHEDLYKHSLAKHLKSLKMFKCKESVLIQPVSGERIVLKETTTRKGGEERGELVVVECFKIPQGHLISVSCVAPDVPGIGNFHYRLEFSSFPPCYAYATFRSMVNRVYEVSGEPPKKYFMVVPFPSGMCLGYKMRITIERNMSNNI